MQEDILWQGLLRTALAVLALPAEEQIRMNGPGSCVACDSDTDFNHSASLALNQAIDLTDEQRNLLEKIAATLQSKQAPDNECFNPDVLNRPVWQDVRILAAEALKAFGWEQTVLQPFVEIRPGILHRPIAEA